MSRDNAARSAANKVKRTINMDVNKKIKEHSDEIIALKQRISNLENRVSILEKK